MPSTHHHSFILTKKMPMLAMGSVTALSFVSQLFRADALCIRSSFPYLAYPSKISKFPLHKNTSLCISEVSVSGIDNARTDNSGQVTATSVFENSSDFIRQTRSSADWKAARAYHHSGSIYEGRIEAFNGGGLLVRFYSLFGFLPFPQLSPSHSCKEPHKSIHEIAKGLTGSLISVKVIQADEENRKLIFSEKEAVWSKYSGALSIGDIFLGRVGSVEDFGAFVHLRFLDGLCHLTGLVHISEVSWDLVQDIRDILNEGDEVKVKIINIDREKSRIALSIKQLEEDPLLETLDKVISQDDSDGSHSLSMSDESTIEPLPGLEAIVNELLKENGFNVESALSVCCSNISSL